MQHRLLFVRLLEPIVEDKEEPSLPPAAVGNDAEEQLINQLTDEVGSSPPSANAEE